MKFKKLEDIPTDLLQSMLKVQYDISAQKIVKLGGYSNSTFKIWGSNKKKYIARLSHSLKPKEQILNEVYVLNQLHEKGHKACPKIVPTLLAEQFTVINFKKSTYALQIFEYIPGIVKYSWEEPCTKTDIRKIFASLPDLHHFMAQIAPNKAQDRAEPVPIIDLLTSAIENQPVGSYLAKEQHIFIKKASHLLHIQEKIKQDSKHLQWIHGDVHLENLLFMPDNSVAFIDFENIQINALELDIIFSAFRVAKIGKTDEQLNYSTKDLQIAFESYALQNNSFTFLADQLETQELLWKALFCLDQALLYLSQASRGVWELEQGIGFLACFNEVLAYEE